MDAGTVDAALATHLKLAEQLRTQLVELQKSLHKPVEEATPPPPATARTTDDRERLMSLARGLSDTEHLQQLCDLAEQLRAKETTAPPAPAPAPEAVVPRRLPAAALNKPASNLVSVQFGAQAGKLGISFEAPSSSDAPRIKAIAPDGAAAEFSDLKVGLVLATIQGQSVAGMKMKEAIAMIRSAGRPLTLEFNHSAQSVFNAASTARDGDYADDSDDSDDDQAFDDARDVEAPQPAPAAAAPTRLAVEFTEQGKLGMSFGSDTDDAVPPIKVTRVTAGGLAAKDSRMRPGLTIVRIAGKDCSSWPLKQIVGTIKASSRPLALEFLEDETPAARSGLPDLTIPGDDDELLGAGVGLPARVEKIKVEEKEDLYSPSGGTRGGGVKILAKAGGEPPELGEYKLLANCKCYKEKELDAAPCDFGLDKGEIFEVQEVALVDDGVIRLRSADGYAHATTHSMMISSLPHRMTSAHVTPVASSCAAFWFACLSASLTGVCVCVGAVRNRRRRRQLD